MKRTISGRRESDPAPDPALLPSLSRQPAAQRSLRQTYGGAGRQKVPSHTAPSKPHPAGHGAATRTSLDASPSGSARMQTTSPFFHGKAGPSGSARVPAQTSSPSFGPSFHGRPSAAGGASVLAQGLKENLAYYKKPSPEERASVFGTARYQYHTGHDGTPLGGDFIHWAMCGGSAPALLQMEMAHHDEEVRAEHHCLHCDACQRKMRKEPEKQKKVRKVFVRNRWYKAHHGALRRELQLKGLRTAAEENDHSKLKSAVSDWEYEEHNEDFQHASQLLQQHEENLADTTVNQQVDCHCQEQLEPILAGWPVNLTELRRMAMVCQKAHESDYCDCLKEALDRLKQYEKKVRLAVHGMDCWALCRLWGDFCGALEDSALGQKAVSLCQKHAMLAKDLLALVIQAPLLEDKATDSIRRSVEGWEFAKNDPVLDVARVWLQLHKSVGERCCSELRLAAKLSSEQVLSHALQVWQAIPANGLDVSTVEEALDVCRNAYRVAGAASFAVPVNKVPFPSHSYDKLDAKMAELSNVLDGISTDTIIDMRSLPVSPKGFLEIVAVIMCLLSGIGLVPVSVLRNSRDNSLDLQAAKHLLYDSELMQHLRTFVRMMQLHCQRSIAHAREEFRIYQVQMPGVWSAEGMAQIDPLAGSFFKFVQLAFAYDALLHDVHTHTVVVPKDEELHSEDLERIVKEHRTGMLGTRALAAPWVVCNGKTEEVEQNLQVTEAYVEVLQQRLGVLTNCISKADAVPDRTGNTRARPPKGSQQDRMLHVVVQSISGQTVADLQVSDSATGVQLKQLVADASGSDFSAQCHLLFDGKPIREEPTLAEHQIPHGAVAVITLVRAAVLLTKRLQACSQATRSLGLEALEIQDSGVALEAAAALCGLSEEVHAKRAGSEELRTVLNAMSGMLFDAHVVVNEAAKGRRPSTARLCFLGSMQEAPQPHCLDVPMYNLSEAVRALQLIPQGSLPAGDARLMKLVGEFVSVMREFYLDFVPTYIYWGITDAAHSQATLALEQAQAAAALVQTLRMRSMLIQAQDAVQPSSLLRAIPSELNTATGKGQVEALAMRDISVAMPHIMRAQFVSNHRIHVLTGSSSPRTPGEKLRFTADILQAYFSPLLYFQTALAEIANGLDVEEFAKRFQYSSFDVTDNDIQLPALEEFRLFVAVYWMLQKPIEVHMSTHEVDITELKERLQTPQQFKATLLQWSPLVDGSSSHLEHARELLLLLWGCFGAGCTERPAFQQLYAWAVLASSLAPLLKTAQQLHATWERVLALLPASSEADATDKDVHSNSDKKEQKLWSDLRWMLYRSEEPWWWLRLVGCAKPEEVYNIHGFAPDFNNSEEEDEAAEMEKQAREQLEREEREREAREKEEREKHEAYLRELQEKEAREKREREARELRERQEREAREQREAAERREREAREQREREARQQEETQKEQREREERERYEREMREQREREERERQEREARERREREAREQSEKEAREKLEKEIRELREKEAKAEREREARELREKEEIARRQQEEDARKQYEEEKLRRRVEAETSWLLRRRRAATEDIERLLEEDPINLTRLRAAVLVAMALFENIDDCIPLNKALAVLSEYEKAVQAAVAASDGWALRQLWSDYHGALPNSAVSLADQATRLRDRHVDVTEDLQRSLESGPHLESSAREEIEKVCREWTFAGNDPSLQAAQTWLRLHAGMAMLELPDRHPAPPLACRAAGAVTFGVPLEQVPPPFPMQQVVEEEARLALDVLSTIQHKDLMDLAMLPKPPTGVLEIVAVATCLLTGTGVPDLPATDSATDPLDLHAARRLLYDDSVLELLEEFIPWLGSGCRMGVIAARQAYAQYQSSMPEVWSVEKMTQQSAAAGALFQFVEHVLEYDEALQRNPLYEVAALDGKHNGEPLSAEQRKDIMAELRTGVVRSPFLCIPWVISGGDAQEMEQGAKLVQSQLHSEKCRVEVYSQAIADAAAAEAQSAAATDRAHDALEVEEMAPLLTITVHSLSGQALAELVVSSAATGSQLKEAIQKQLGALVSSPQCLLFEGAHISDSATLASQGITSGAALVLIQMSIHLQVQLQLCGDAIGSCVATIDDSEDKCSALRAAGILCGLPGTVTSSGRFVDAPAESVLNSMRELISAACDIVSAASDGHRPNVYQITFCTEMQYPVSPSSSLDVPMENICIADRVQSAAPSKTPVTELVDEFLKVIRVFYLEFVPLYIAWGVAAESQTQAEVAVHGAEESLAIVQELGLRPMTIKSPSTLLIEGHQAVSSILCTTQGDCQVQAIGERGFSVAAPHVDRAARAVCRHIRLMLEEPAAPDPSGHIRFTMAMLHIQVSPLLYFEAALRGIGESIDYDELVRAASNSEGSEAVLHRPPPPEVFRLFVVVLGILKSDSPGDVQTEEVMKYFADCQSFKDFLTAWSPLRQASVVQLRHAKAELLHLWAYFGAGCSQRKALQSLYAWAVLAVALEPLLSTARALAPARELALAAWCLDGFMTDAPKNPADKVRAAWYGLRGSLQHPADGSEEPWWWLRLLGADDPKAAYLRHGYEPDQILEIKTDDELSARLIKPPNPPESDGKVYEMIAVEHKASSMDAGKNGQVVDELQLLELEIAADDQKAKQKKHSAVSHASEFGGISKTRPQYPRWWYGFLLVGFLILMIASIAWLALAAEWRCFPFT